MSGIHDCCRDKNYIRDQMLLFIYMVCGACCLPLLEQRAEGGGTYGRTNNGHKNDMLPEEICHWPGMRNLLATHLCVWYNENAT